MQMLIGHAERRLVAAGRQRPLDEERSEALRRALHGAERRVQPVDERARRGGHRQRGEVGAAARARWCRSCASAASRSRSMLPVATDWLVTRNVSTSETVCACAGAAATSSRAPSHPARQVCGCGIESSSLVLLDANVVALIGAVRLPHARAARRRGRGADRRTSPFLKSVDRSTTIDMPSTSERHVRTAPQHAGQLARRTHHCSAGGGGGVGVGGRCRRRCRSRCRGWCRRWCRSRCRGWRRSRGRGRAPDRAPARRPARLCSCWPAIRTSPNRRGSEVGRHRQPDRAGATFRSEPDDDDDPARARSPRSSCSR